ncbi:testis-expressed protein 44 isoform X2 [Phascolarctos cinereus]
MSSNSLQNSAAAASTENENPESALNDNSAVELQDLNLTQGKDELLPQGDDELSQIYWDSETAMGTATGLLNASHMSVTDVLHGTGTALRSMTSLLGRAHNVFTSGLFSGTGTVFRTMSQFLGNIERRTVNGIRSAFRFMALHISLHRNNAGNN